MELKEELEALTLKLEGKSQTEVKSAIEAFEVKNKEVIDNQIKEVKESFEVQLKELQDHADKLDVKLQAKTLDSKGAKSLVEEIKEKNHRLKTLLLRMFLEM